MLKLQKSNDGWSFYQENEIEGTYLCNIFQDPYLVLLQQHLICEYDAVEEENLIRPDLNCIHPSYNDCIENIKERIKAKINAKIPRFCLYQYEEYADEYTSFDIISHLRESYSWSEIGHGCDVEDVIQDFADIAFKNEKDIFLLRLFFENEYEVVDGIVKDYSYEDEEMLEDTAIVDIIMKDLFNDMECRASEIEEAIADSFFAPDDDEEFDEEDEEQDK